MKPVLAIARRELDHYFATPVGWISVCGFLLMQGFFFALMVTQFSIEATNANFNPYGQDLNINEYLLPGFFGNWSVVLLFICPAVAMSLFSEDVRQKSFELLLSSPISSMEIVLGKFLGALGFLAVMFACTLHFVAILFWLGAPDPGVIAACYGTMFMVAACFVAVGMFFSSWTTSQVVAFVLSFGGLLCLWVLSWTDAIATGTLGEVLSNLSVLSHMEQPMKGLLHSKDLVYFVSFIGFFLFATQQRVEATRWR